MSTEHPPAIRRTVTPYLLVPDVRALIGFLTAAFDATTQLLLDRTDGSVMHAELRLGDSLIMLGEPTGDLAPTSASLYLSVDDCDAVHRRAVAAGGTSLMEPTTMPHAGERYGGVVDPAGTIWWVATRLDDLPADEQQRRIDAGDAPSPSARRPSE